MKFHQRFKRLIQREILCFRKQLYQRELAAKYQYGSVLFYRYDTWHRGTSLN